MPEWLLPLLGTHGPIVAAIVGLASAVAYLARYIATEQKRHEETIAALHAKHDEELAKLHEARIAEMKTVTEIAHSQVELADRLMRVQSRRISKV